MSCRGSANTCTRSCWWTAVPPMARLRWPAALRPDIRIVSEEGSGKGAALRTGFEAATGDIIVMLDADCSTDPAEIPLFMGALLAGADFVKGSRFIQGGGTADMPFHRKLGNWGFVWLVRLLFGGSYSDLCYGYIAFWKHVLPALRLDADGFEIETMMNIRALRAGLRVVEVPSFEYERHHGVGQLKTFSDGWRVLKMILRERSTRVGMPRYDSTCAQGVPQRADSSPIDEPIPSVGPGVRQSASRRSHAQSVCMPLERSAVAPLRVVMATPRYLPSMGGVEQHVHEVAPRLAEAGLSVTVLTTDTQGTLPRIEKCDGVEIRRVPAWPRDSDYYFAPAVHSVIRHEAWDLVHVQSYHTFVAPLAMSAALRARIPFVLTFHGGGHSSRIRNRSRRAQLLLLRPLLARAERLVAVARFEIELYARRLRLPEERFVLIPNGSNLPVNGTAHGGANRRLDRLCRKAREVQRASPHPRCASRDHPSTARGPALDRRCRAIRTRVAPVGG